MCGNDVSVIADPNEVWRNQLQRQIQHGQITIVNRPISLSNILFFSSCQTFKIQSMELSNCNIDHKTISELMKNNFINLQKLVLNGNKIGAAGCKTLVSSTSLRNLKCLQLNDNNIRDAGAQELEKASFLKLEDLSLNNNNISERGIRSLKIFDRIQYLSLSSNFLTDENISEIKEINPKGFVFIRLSKNKFTDKALAAFLEMKNLEVLMIDRNQINCKKTDLSIPQSLFFFC